MIEKLEALNDKKLYTLRDVAKLFCFDIEKIRTDRKRRHLKVTTKQLVRYRCNNTYTQKHTYMCSKKDILSYYTYLSKKRGKNLTF